jgi:hypothetical protein
MVKKHSWVQVLHVNIIILCKMSWYHFINLYTNFISCTYFIYLKYFQIFTRYFLLFLQECIRILDLLDMTFWRDVFRVWLDISAYLYCMITYIFFSDRKPSLHSCKKSKKYLVKIWKYFNDVTKAVRLNRQHVCIILRIFVTWPVIIIHAFKKYYPRQR